MPETSPDLLRKVYDPAEVNFAPGERSFVAWISTETIDHEGDVVVAKGIDFTTVYLPKNPVVMAFHDYGRWPVGKSDWIKSKTTSGFAGLYARTVMDDDPDSEILWKKIQNRTVRGISIGFKPPIDMQKSEWGPPTPDELRKNPHWKGAARIIRRCLLFEYSIVPIPMNSDALITAVAKGMCRPQYLGQEPPAMDETEEKVEPETEIEVVTEEAEVKVKAMTEGSSASGGAATKSEDEADDDEKPPEFKKGDYAKCLKGEHSGAVGKVKSVHKGEMVPDVEQECMSSKSDPAVRLCIHKAMGSGHIETSHHIGVKCKELQKIDELVPPQKTKKGIDPAMLPPLVGKSDAEVQAEQFATLKKTLTPTFLKAELIRAQDRALGAV